MRRLCLLACAALLALAGCSSQQEKPPYPGIKIGKPYQIYGRWYKPRYDKGYDETGIASWYGPGFHGNKTANGERFNENDLTAAHPTLPLPSIVRVTNLTNGRSALIRVNDRGPFARDRILDLSKGSATRLGIIASGTARVRVQFLEKETREYVENSNARSIQYAMEKIQQVDPAAAAQEQEKLSTPKFYVMKVPADKAPPPASVAMSDKDAAHYPAGDIFAMANDEAVREAAKPTSYLSLPAQGGARYVQASANNTSSYNAGLFVQAGAFGNKANAEKLVNKLQDTQNPRVITTRSSSRTLYRVLLGPYKQPEGAKSVIARLESFGISDAKLVRD